MRGKAKSKKGLPLSPIRTFCTAIVPFSSKSPISMGWMIFGEGISSSLWDFTEGNKRLADSFFSNGSFFLFLHRTEKEDAIYEEINVLNHACGIIGDDDELLCG
ncbi:MAG: hypothetical protein J5548_05170 [Prevotella sp.]|nr:hypothetical protein [Prevotella sp.]